MDLTFKDFLAATQEGILLPDKPSVPGLPRINTTPFPRSRYLARPHLRPPTPTGVTAPAKAAPWPKTRTFG